MSSLRRTTKCKPDPSKEVSPMAFIICFSSIAISSVLQISLTIYLLKAEVTESLHVVNEALTLSSSTVSLIYCAVYYFFFVNRKTRSYRPGRLIDNKPENLIALSFVALLWLATFTLDCVIAVKRTVERRSSKSSQLGDDSYYKIQLVNAGTALFALLSICILFRLIQYSSQLSVASAEPSYNNLDLLEDEYRLSRKPSTISSITPSDASILNPEFFGYHSLESARLKGQTSAVRSLDFEYPPTPRSHDRLFYPPNHFVSAKSQNWERIPLPIAHHSRSLSVPTSSQDSGDLDLFYTLPNGHMQSPSGSPLVERNPEVPKIPQQFRWHNRNNSWADPKPTRPESKPSMPPAAFWMYAAERQTREALPGSLQSWQVNSDGRRFDPSIKRPPISAKGPEKAANKESTTQWTNLATRISYENSEPADFHDDDPRYPNISRGRTRDIKDERKHSCNNAAVSREEKRSRSRKLIKKGLACDGGLYCSSGVRDL